MLKKCLALALATLMIVSFAACGSYGSTPASSAAPAAPASSSAMQESSVPATDAPDFSSFDEVKIKFAHWFGETHPQHIAIQKFQQLCAEKSGGKIVVEIYGNGQLGPEDTYIDSIKQGTVEMGATGTLMARDVPGIAIAEMPFLFSSWEHAKGTLGGEIGMKITESMPEACGMRTLAWTVNGFREVSSNKSVASLEDFKGLRLRVPNTPVYIKMFEALGVNPIAMPLTEVFTALEQKVADGQDNPYATVRASSFYEVQSYMLETRHMFSPIEWVINEKFYQGLPEEFRQIVDESIREAADENWKLSQEADDTDKQWLIDQGMEVTVPDNAMRQQLIDAQVTAGVYEWFYQEYPGSEELEKEIRAWKG
ncbi:C4-dicarboxylate ABC transporter substrate-binding protein [Anaerotruncus sp. AF02-27]|jgi:tripartite ATP-independent transporter DctP family solute receptor|uniref:TRAP transporter substrate-binding protein n=1 Tax=Anaerotruncus TaxID=244127 RepID=UPI000E4E081D|nr:MULTISPECIES: TRAP transporter substrate-binding protein [Anaerotruncus]RGX52807.1 C4-dicarboxylate ABC transporter substrate-binding protein [Anaerotruncus sp. AF02-27]